MITIRQRAYLVLSRSHRFHEYHKTVRKSLSAICFDNINLKSESRLFDHCAYRNYASVPKLSLQENDKKKFLNHIVDAYTYGKKSEFEKLLCNHSVKKLIDEKIKINDDIKNLEELEEDKEMKKLAAEEKLACFNHISDIDNELIELILENFYTDNYDDVIIEMNAGVGGQEAMLFVKDLSEMYIKHFTHLGYSFNIIELDNSDQGGIRHISIMVSGKQSYKKLRHEAGVHRVQRVPVTEKSGRMHTSVVSVAVLPQPNEIEVSIEPKDLKVDVMRSSGAGGQSVNTTNSAVRITHIPSGIVAECQVDRSQIRNRELAMAKLRARIYERKLDKQVKSASSLRKKQMGMGERHEKIRTYNYSQDRITDHRLKNGTMHNLKGFLEGGESLNKLHEQLHQQSLHEIFLEAVKNVK